MAESTAARRPSLVPAADIAKQDRRPSEVGNEPKAQSHPAESDRGGSSAAGASGNAIAQPTPAAEQHVPKADAQNAGASKADAPKVDEPKPDTPKAVTPKTEAPKAKMPEDVLKVPDFTPPEASSSSHAARGSFEDERHSHLGLRPPSSAAAPSVTSDADSQRRAASASGDGRHSEMTGSTGRRSTDGKPQDRHYLLPKDVPNARVLQFACDRPRRSKKPDEFLTEAASKFLEYLLEERKNVDSKVPIVFLAHGVGCLVLQRAMSQLPESLAYVPDQTAGIIFAHALFPETEEEPSKRTEATSSNQPKDVPVGSNAGITPLLKDWIDKKSIDAKDVWKSFYGKAHTIPVVWFYSRSEKHAAKSDAVLVLCVALQR